MNVWAMDVLPDGNFVEADPPVEPITTKFYRTNKDKRRRFPRRYPMTPFAAFILTDAALLGLLVCSLIWLFKTSAGAIWQKVALAWPLAFSSAGRRWRRARSSDTRSLAR